MIFRAISLLPGLISFQARSSRLKRRWARHGVVGKVVVPGLIGENLCVFRGKWVLMRSVNSLLHLLVRKKN